LMQHQCADGLHAALFGFELAASLQWELHYFLRWRPTFTE